MITTIVLSNSSVHSRLGFKFIKGWACDWFTDILQFKQDIVYRIVRKDTEVGFSSFLACALLSYRRIWLSNAGVKVPAPADALCTWRFFGVRTKSLPFGRLIGGNGGCSGKERGSIQISCLILGLSIREGGCRAP